MLQRERERCSLQKKNLKKTRRGGDQWIPEAQIQGTTLGSVLLTWTANSQNVSFFLHITPGKVWQMIQQTVENLVAKGKVWLNAIHRTKILRGFMPLCLKLVFIRLALFCLGRGMPLWWIMTWRPQAYWHSESRWWTLPQNLTRTRLPCRITYFTVPLCQSNTHLYQHVLCRSLSLNVDRPTCVYRCISLLSLDTVCCVWVQVEGGVLFIKSRFPQNLPKLPC